MAAVAVSGAETRLPDAVRSAAPRLLHTEPGARLACLSVTKANRVGMDE